MFEPKAATQRLAIQQVGRAVTPESLSNAHRAGEMAASPFYRQAERLLSMSIPLVFIEGAGGAARARMCRDTETERLVAELQKNAADAYVSAAARALGVDPATLANPFQ